VGFSAGVAVGLAPFLGVLKVPLFTPLLALYPVTLQSRLIPISGAVMGLAAVTIQWYGAERLSRRWLRRAFLSFLAVAGLALVLLLFVRAAFVVDVPIQGGEQQAAFVVGWNRLPTCPCTENSDPLCIRNTLTLNPAQIETCWNSRAVRFGELLLQFNYLAFIACFGAITGLVVLRESAGTTRLPTVVERGRSKRRS
jgi:hypothetical protein